MRLAPAPSRRTSLSTFGRSLCALAAWVWLAGCAAPGAPTPPMPIVPKVVADLAARQQGESVVLTFTLPRQDMDGEKLVEMPALEIFRGERPAGATGKMVTSLVYTVPSAVVDTYLREGQINFRDPLKPGSAAGQEMVYMVRTRASKKRASDDSNVVSVRVVPVPPAPVGIRATVTEPAIELTWTAPSQGPLAGAIAGYRVYRAELAAAALPPNLADLSQVQLRAPLQLMGPAQAAPFRDTQFTFGTTYVYVVRSVADSEGQPVESSDSQLVAVAPKDIFPPAAPQRLITIIIPATESAPAHVELSWDISAEPDLSGYWVYRSEQPDTPGLRINAQILLSPTFRDMTAVQGKRYTYRVSAVDRNGNESPLSSPVPAEFPRQGP